MRPSREDGFIKCFLSAYEDGSWADADSSKPDAIDRTNPAVDRLATRKCDRKTLAIEHTIIEPFVGEKEDFKFFDQALLTIEADESLTVPGRWIQVFVPVGILKNRHKVVERDAIVQSIHRWIESNRLTLSDGVSQSPCTISGIPGKPPFEITLNLNVVSFQRYPAAKHGILHVRRQQVEDNLGEVIEKALREKLPKLVNTNSDKHILLLERQHMNLEPRNMLDEIEKLRAAFPDLARIDEIWIMETIFYGTTFGGTYLRFELYKDGNVVRSLDFNEGKLISTSQDWLGDCTRQEP